MSSEPYDARIVPGFKRPFEEDLCTATMRFDERR